MTERSSDAELANRRAETSDEKPEKEFIRLMEQAKSLDLLEVGGMWQEGARKSRYVLTEKGIDALQGRQGTKKKRLLFRIAALYQKLTEIQAVSKDSTNEKLPYSLSALLEEMEGLERKENHVKTPQVQTSPSIF